MTHRAASPPERAAVIDAIRSHLEECQEILWAYLHGSSLGAGPYRDIDVAVWVEPKRGHPPEWLRGIFLLRAEGPCRPPQPPDGVSIPRVDIALDPA